MPDVQLSRIIKNYLPSATQIQSRELGNLAVAGTAGGAFTASATPSAFVQVLSLSTPGILHSTWVRQGNSTSKTVGIRVLIDGVEVANRTRAVASTTAGNGVIVGLLGNPDNVSLVIGGGFAPFQTLAIEVNSSVASDTAGTWAAYYTLL